MNKAEIETLVIRGIILGMDYGNNRITEGEYLKRKNKLISEI